MNTESSKTNGPHRFRLKLSDKFNLKDPSKNMTLANLKICYTWKNVKSAYNNNKFKISAPTWNDKFDLPDGSCSVSDIQDYLEFIIKKHETLTENSPVQIYLNKIINSAIFKTITGYKLQILSPEKKKKKGVDQDIYGEDVPKLESVEAGLVHTI